MNHFLDEFQEKTRVRDERERRDERQEGGGKVEKAGEEDERDALGEQRSASQR